MATVKLLRGEPITVHMVAPSDVVPGQVVLRNNIPFIAINRAASGQVAAFAAGGGVYGIVTGPVHGTLIPGLQALFSTTGKFSQIDSPSDGQCMHLGFWVNVSAGYGEFVHNPSGQLPVEV